MLLSFLFASWILLEEYFHIFPCLHEKILLFCFCLCMVTAHGGGTGRRRPGQPFPRLCAGRTHLQESPCNPGATHTPQILLQVCIKLCRHSPAPTAELQSSQWGAAQAAQFWGATRSVSNCPASKPEALWALDSSFFPFLLVSKVFSLKTQISAILHQASTYSRMCLGQNVIVPTSTAAEFSEHTPPPQLGDLQGPGWTSQSYTHSHSLFRGPQNRNVPAHYRASVPPSMQLLPLLTRRQRCLCAPLWACCPAGTLWAVLGHAESNSCLAERLFGTHTRGRKISVFKALLPPSQNTFLIPQLPKNIIQISSLPSTMYFIPQGKLPPTCYFSKSQCFPPGIVLAELHIIIPCITFKASGTKWIFFLIELSQALNLHHGRSAAILKPFLSRLAPSTAAAADCTRRCSARHQESFTG